MCTNGWHLLDGQNGCNKNQTKFIVSIMFIFVCAIEIFYKLSMVENLWSWVFEGSMNPKPLHTH